MCRLLRFLVFRSAPFFFFFVLSVNQIAKRHARLSLFACLAPVQHSLTADELCGDTVPRVAFPLLGRTCAFVLLYREIFYVSDSAYLRMLKTLSSDWFSY